MIVKSSFQLLNHGYFLSVDRKQIWEAKGEMGTTFRQNIGDLHPYPERKFEQVLGQFANPIPYN